MADPRGRARIAEQHQVGAVLGADGELVGGGVEGDDAGRRDGRQDLDAEVPEPAEADDDHGGARGEAVADLAHQRAAGKHKHCDQRSSGCGVRQQHGRAGGMEIGE